VAQLEQVLYTGVILNDFSREGSGVYHPWACPPFISASRQILRKLRMTSSTYRANKTEP
jgi:hypothetical protein